MAWFGKKDRNRAWEVQGVQAVTPPGLEAAHAIRSIHVSVFHMSLTRSACHVVRGSLEIHHSYLAQKSQVSRKQHFAYSNPPREAQKPDPKQMATTAGSSPSNALY